MSDSNWLSIPARTVVREIPAHVPVLPRAPEELPGAREVLPIHRRFSPRKNRWQEVALFDARVREFDERIASLGDHLVALRERLTEAIRADQRALADWQLNDAKGARPEPTANAIEAQIQEKEADVAAAEAAQRHVLEEKSRYVDKHRRRLVREAEAATSRATETYQTTISATEQARAALVEARAAETWARFFPEDIAITSPPVASLAAGLRKPVESTLGISTVIAANAVFEALRADASVVSEALTREQANRLGKLRPGRDTAIWIHSPEGQEQLQREQSEKVERVRREWGFPH